MLAGGLDETLAALADPTRRRVIDLLCKSPRRPGELAAGCETSPPAMSRHLKILRTRGLIEEDRGVDNDARVRIYRLRREPFDELQSWLRKMEMYWKDQLDAFTEHAERARRDRGGEKRR